jgi:reactive intermediate/imine deaminase
MATVSPRSNVIKRIVVGTGVPPPRGPYSHAVIANGFVFLSGQGPRDPATGSYPEGIEKQTRQAMRNIMSLLGSIGLTLSDVVKSTVYLRHINDFQRFNEVYGSFFKGELPARTTVQATPPLPEILVEIEALAVMRSTQRGKVTRRQRNSSN